MVNGGKQASSSESGGFNALPSEIKATFSNLATDTQNNFLNGNGVDMFTPVADNSDLTSAYAALRGGFAPTQSSLNSDIAMQMNPFDDYVVDGYNRQAVGDYSQVKSAMNNAGVLGSNRDILGANDVDLTRLQQIGQFKQGQFNTAMNNALTTLPGLRQQDAQNQLGVGQAIEGKATAAQQAQYAALQAAAALMGVLPSKEGSSSSSSSGWNFGYNP